MGMCFVCPLSPHKSSRAIRVNDMSYISTFLWVAFLKMDCFLQELDFLNVLELVQNLWLDSLLLHATPE